MFGTKFVGNDMFPEPFLKNQDLECLVINETSHLPTPREKAERLFQWMQQEITYGEDTIHQGYRNSLDTFYDKTGICVEQAYLYVTLARLAGLEAYYVEVDETENGKDNHACAAINLEGYFVYVDPAYHKFDVQHRKVRVLSDIETVKKFRRSAGKFDDVDTELLYIPPLLPHVAAVVLGGLFSFYCWSTFTIEKTVRIADTQLVVAGSAYDYMNQCFPLLSHRAKWLQADRNKDGHLTEYEAAIYVEELIEGLHTQKSVLDVQPGT